MGSAAMPPWARSSGRRTSRASTTGSVDARSVGLRGAPFLLLYAPHVQVLVAGNATTAKYNPPKWQISESGYYSILVASCSLKELAIDTVRTSAKVPATAAAAAAAAAAVLLHSLLSCVRVGCLYLCGRLMGKCSF